MFVHLCNTPARKVS